MNPEPARRKIPRSQDAVRIVPLHLPEGVTRHLEEPTAAASPKLTYRGGPLLTAVKVFNIYWGGAWEDPQQKTLSAALDGFFGFVLTSELIDQLDEYSTRDYKIGHGRFAGSTVVTSPAVASTVSDTSIRRMLQKQTSGSGPAPSPDPNTLYFVYLPPGVAVTQGGAGRARPSAGITTARAGNCSTP